jgi:large subunit ribosomal protein L17
MRHRVQDKKFNRDSNARKALFTGLLRNLIEHGSIVTTHSRAKAVKGLIDRSVSQAKDNSLASRRLLHRTFGKRDVVNTLVDKVAPAHQDRTSGFTRIEALGPRRGDNTSMAKVSFVNQVEGIGTLKSGKTYEEKAEKKSQVPNSKSQKVAKAEKVVAEPEAKVEAKPKAPKKTVAKKAAAK